AARSRGPIARRAKRFSFSVSMPEVPTIRSTSFSAEAKSWTAVADSRMSAPCMARFRASMPNEHGLTRTRSAASKFFIARATAPTLPSFFGSTNTIRVRGRTSARYIQRGIFLGMRVALKIAYDGRSFYGHQRQPDRRTVEGECIAALRSARLIGDPKEAFFRSASRTDVTRSRESTLIDVRSRSFRRGMVRRIVAAMEAVARDQATIEQLRLALAGTRRDFGSVPPEPLVLMDVTYDLPFHVALKPKVVAEWRQRERESLLRLQLFRAARAGAENGVLFGDGPRFLGPESVWRLSDD